MYYKTGDLNRLKVKDNVKVSKGISFYVELALFFLGLSDEF